jgi:signal transduction histidine kinase
VSVSAVAADGCVELHVRDDGPGFEPEMIDHAFERFVRGRRDDPRGGTGLGLAIVAVIARSHGGNVRAANLAGGGADVWMELGAASTSEHVVPHVSGVRR